MVRLPGILRCHRHNHDMISCAVSQHSYVEASWRARAAPYLLLQILTGVSVMTWDMGQAPDHDTDWKQNTRLVFPDMGAVPAWANNGGALARVHPAAPLLSRLHLNPRLPGQLYLYHRHQHPQQLEVASRRNNSPSSLELLRLLNNLQRWLDVLMDPWRREPGPMPVAHPHNVPFTLPSHSLQHFSVSPPPGAPEFPAALLPPPAAFPKPQYRPQLSAQEWDTLRPAIKRLYIDEKKTFSEVAKFLRENHDFNPT